MQRQVLEFEPAALSDEIKTLRYDVDKENDTRFKAKLELILENASDELKRALQAASEKGASSWVTAIPSFDHGTVLHKGEFTDAVYIRYGWNLLNLAIAITLLRRAGGGGAALGPRPPLRADAA